MTTSVASSRFETYTKEQLLLIMDDKVLVGLRYFASGLPLRDAGDLFGIHKSSAGKCITKVTDVICGFF